VSPPVVILGRSLCVSNAGLGAAQCAYASWYGAIPVPSWRAHINFYALCTANTMTAIDLRVDLPKWIRDGPKRGA